MATLHPMEVTKELSASDSQLATLASKHGHRKLWAGVKALGLTKDDIDKHSHKQNVSVSDLVPSASAPKLHAQRTKMWDDLRQDRMKALGSTLEDMNDDDVRRYEKCTGSVNPVTEDDLPPIETLSGMDKFLEMQDKAQKKVKAEQARRAHALGMDFLTTKKKMDDADAKVAAFEKRMEDYRKAQAEEWKARSLNLQKKAEKRQQDAARAAQQRAQYEDELDTDLLARMQGANARRTHRYSPAGLSAKLEANKMKRQKAYQTACQQEDELLEQISAKQDAQDLRLQEEHELKLERYRQAREDSQARFQNRQVVIHAKTTEWVENKLQEHDKFNNKIEDTRVRRKDLMKEHAKSVADTRKKTWEKVKANKDKNQHDTDEANDALLAKFHAADVRREELNSMKLKCEIDIHTHTETKHKSFGELVSRRQEEIKNRTANNNQATIYMLAERQATQNAQRGGNAGLRLMRQEIGKQSLTFQDAAYEGFLKIQSEPDEAKVIQHMNKMGFDMPSLPTADEEGEEEERKAF